MNIIKRSMKMAHNFTVWEIGIFKVYLIAVAWLFALRFPVLLTASVWFYVVFTLVMLVPLVINLVHHHGNYIAKMFSSKKPFHVMKDWSMVEVSMFKLGMVLFALLVAKVFPVLLTAHIGVYLIVAGFGIGYFIAKLLK